MKPLFQDLPFPINHQIHFHVEDLPYFIVPWHFHPAIEIMYITGGTGTRFVGDHIEGYLWKRCRKETKSHRKEY